MRLNFGSVWKILLVIPVVILVLSFYMDMDGQIAKEDRAREKRWAPTMFVPIPSPSEIVDKQVPTVGPTDTPKLSRCKEISPGTIPVSGDEEIRWYPPLQHSKGEVVVKRTIGVGRSLEQDEINLIKGSCGPFHLGWPWIIFLTRDAYLSPWFDVDSNLHIKIVDAKLALSLDDRDLILLSMETEIAYEAIAEHSDGRKAKAEFRLVIINYQGDSAIFVLMFKES